MGKRHFLGTAASIVAGVFAVCGVLVTPVEAKIVLKAGSTNAETPTDPYAMPAPFQP